MLLIPGTSRFTHLEENRNLARITLTGDDIGELETDSSSLQRIGILDRARGGVGAAG